MTQRRDTQKLRVTPDMIVYHTARARRLRLRAYRKAFRAMITGFARVIGKFRR